MGMFACVITGHYTYSSPPQLLALLVKLNEHILNILNNLLTVYLNLTVEILRENPTLRKANLIRERKNASWRHTFLTKNTYATIISTLAVHFSKNTTIQEKALRPFPSTQKTRGPHALHTWKLRNQFRSFKFLGPSLTNLWDYAMFVTSFTCMRFTGPMELETATQYERQFSMLSEHEALFHIVILSCTPKPSQVFFWPFVIWAQFSFHMNKEHDSSSDSSSIKRASPCPFFLLLSNRGC